MSRQPKRHGPQIEDDVIFDKIKQDSNISASTKNNYITYLKRVRKICEIAEQNVITLKELILAPKHTMELLENEMKDKSMASLSQLVLAIKAVLNIAGEVLELDVDAGLEQKKIAKLKYVWGEIHKPIEAQLKARRKENVPSEHQDKSVIKWSRVYDNNLKLREKAFSTLEMNAIEDLLLSSFYVVLEPRRVLDYTRLIIKRKCSDVVSVEPGASAPSLEDETPNVTGFVCMECSDICVLKHKNVKKTGPWSKKMPAQLVQDLKLLLAHDSERQFVFQGFKTANAFSTFQRKKLMQWFGMPVSTTTLRHARATQAVGDPTMSLMDKEKISGDMGHKFDMHLQYAFKPHREKDGSFVIEIFDPILMKFVDYVCQRKV